MGHVDRRRWHDRHRHRRYLFVRRLVCRCPSRPFRPRARAADCDLVVFDLHLLLCLRTEFRAAVHPARTAWARLRRRVGHRRGIDGRGDPRQISRPRRRLRANRRRHRSRIGGAGLRRPLRHSARGDCLAGAVCSRHPARSASPMDPPQHPGIGSIRGPAQHWHSAQDCLTCNRRFAGRICGSR
jgi:hypothetical protein